MRKIDWEIIAKDIDNQTSISEKKKLKKWLDASEQHYKYYNKVKQNYFKQLSFDKKSNEIDFLKLIFCDILVYILNIIMLERQQKILLKRVVLWPIRTKNHL